MKKISSSILLVFVFTLLSSAQVKVSTDNPDLGVQVKRSFAQGDVVFVDLFLISDTDWDCVQLFSFSAYDDEGNTYTFFGKRDIDVFLEGEVLSKCNAVIQLERGIPRKVRIRFNNVDEYASAFSLIKIEWRCHSKRVITSTQVFSTIKNLPITRE